MPVHRAHYQPDGSVRFEQLHPPKDNKMKLHSFIAGKEVSDAELDEYLRSFKEGERVIEDQRGHAFDRCEGVVYISQNEGPSFGSLCVRWELPDGSKMGTSITGGTRRLEDVSPETGACVVDRE